MAQLDDFWCELSTLCKQLEQHYATDNIDLAERLTCQCSVALELLRVIYGRVDESIHAAGLDVHSGTTEIRILLALVEVIRFLQCRLLHFSEMVNAVDCALVRSESSPEVYRTGRRGRPPFIIPLDHLEALIELGLTMSSIASIFGVSEPTLSSRREMYYGLPISRDQYSPLEDAQLDQIVSEIMQVSPHPKHTHTQISAVLPTYRLLHINLLCKKTLPKYSVVARVLHLKLCCTTLYHILSPQPHQVSFNIKCLPMNITHTTKFGQEENANNLHNLQDCGRTKTFQIL